jgi:hypothetical protein
MAAKPLVEVTPQILRKSENHRLRATFLGNPVVTEARTRLADARHRVDLGIPVRG